MEKREGGIPEEQILALLGKKTEIWNQIRQYLSDFYPDCEPIHSIEGKDKNHTIRFRKSGKTLVTLYPTMKTLVVPRRGFTKIWEVDNRTSYLYPALEEWL